MPTTCLVCGATEETGPDRTCPVCGADLPAVDDLPAGEDPATSEDLPADQARDDTVTPPPTQPGTWPVPPPPPSGPASPPPPSGPAWPPSAASAPSAAPHPSSVDASMRTYGMLTHLSAFAGAIVALAFVGPLVMWLIRRDEHPFLDHHGTEALNFNLSMLLYGVIGVVASVATLGLGLVVVAPAVVVFFVTWVVCTIVGAVKANNGEGYRYPLTIRFVKER